MASRVVRVRVVRRRRVGAARRPAMGRRPGTVVKRGRIGVQPVHYYKRTLYLSGALTASSAGDVFGAIDFRLNQLPNATDFTNLYDQYKIRGVKIMLIPRGNNSDVITGATSGQSMGVFSALDYDDVTPPTSIAQLCEYQNMKMTRSTSIHSRYFVPKPQINLLVAGGGTSPALSGQWIDTALGVAPHYGFKYALQQLPNGTQLYDIKYTFYLAFKNVR